MEKRRILQQWAACLVGMKCRDDAHQTVREALRYAPPPPTPVALPGVPPRRGAGLSSGRAGPAWSQVSRPLGTKGAPAAPLPP